MAKKKVVLLLVEGYDEVKGLERSMDKIFSNNKTLMKMTEGDIFLDKSVSSNNA